MLRSGFFLLVRDKRLSIPILRCFHPEFSQTEIIKKEHLQKKAQNLEEKKLEGLTTTTGAVSRKYKVFRDEDSPEIFDVEEERNRFQIQDEQEENIDDNFLGLNLERGVNGVFEVEDLVEVLRKEAAQDIFVCRVPKDLKYVDYMVVCSCRSFRHMLATAEFVRKIFKLKRDPGDILPKIEGEKSREWMALDLGNIALHIFSPDVREEYDLESLWAIGSQYDKQCNKPLDPLLNFLEKSKILLEDKLKNN